MSTYEGRSDLLARRLQVVLLLMLLWDVLAAAADLSFGGPLLKISGDKVTGLLAAKGAINGAVVVPIGMYLYAIVRGPLRHRAVLWAAGLEQGAAVFFAIWHLAIGDIRLAGFILPMIVASTLLVLLLINLPRGQAPSTS